MNIPTRFARPAAIAALAAAALAVTPAVASAKDGECDVKAMTAWANHLMDDAVDAASKGQWEWYWRFVEGYGNVMGWVGKC